MPFQKLRYHIVTGTYQGLSLITPEIEKPLYKLMQDEASTLSGKLIAIGGIENHVHAVGIIPASITIAEFILKVKNNSSRKIKQLYEEIVRAHV